MERKDYLSVKVFGEEYHLEVLPDEDSRVMGRFDSSEKKIFIREKLSERDFFHTLIHEIGHGLFYRNSFYQSIPSELEEVIVDSFATIMVENFNFTLPKKRGRKKKLHETNKTNQSQ